MTAILSDVDVLRRYVVSVLTEAREFDEWLSSDVMRVLISNYALPSSRLGSLKWEYAELPRGRWGEFAVGRRIRGGRKLKPTLFVNKAKTRDMFKQQVETILHEIQHWNQLAELADERELDLDDAAAKMGALYDLEMQRRGYHGNSYEVDARAYATKNLDDAIKRIGAHYGKHVEGDLDDVIEELVDTYTDEGRPLTRREVSQALVDYGKVGPQYLNDVLAQLRSLDVEVRG